MEAGARVRANVDGNSRNGRVISRVIEPPLNLEVDRYTVKLDDSPGTCELNLEQLVYIGPDHELDDDGSDTFYSNGELMFCKDHRLEICNKCGYQFRFGNLLKELSPEMSFDEKEGWVAQIERAKDFAECVGRKAPRRGEPMITERMGDRKRDLLNGSILPRNINPPTLGDCHFTQVRVLFPFNHNAFPVSSPLLKEMRKTVQEIAIWQEEFEPSKRSMIGLQDEAQSEVLWICVESIHVLSKYRGGAVPLIVVRWQHASETNKVISYIDAGPPPTEVRCSVEEIHAFYELLSRNGECMDQNYVKGIKAKYRPRDWKVSAIGPIVNGEEGTLASLRVPMPWDGGEGSTASAENVSNACDQCRRTDIAVLKKCSRCKVAKYCSKDCQKLAWKKHKRSCQPVSS